MYDVKADDSLSWYDYNTYPSNIRKLLKSRNATKRHISYDYRKMVIFNSKYFHETDGVSTIPCTEDENHKSINLTLLFVKHEDSTISSLDDEDDISMYGLCDVGSSCVFRQHSYFKKHRCKPFQVGCEGACEKFIHPCCNSKLLKLSPSVIQARSFSFVCSSCSDAIYILKTHGSTA
jgi:hypothetical protein